MAHSLGLDQRLTLWVEVLRQAQTFLQSYVDADGQPFPFTAQLFSALKRIGLDEANDKILELAGLNQPVETAEPMAPAALANEGAGSADTNTPQA